MPKIDLSHPLYYASSVTEAIGIARQLQRRANFDLFRGQIRNFPVRPSIFRDGINRQAAADKLGRFADWVHRTPELGSLHAEPDAILAVAQHYGIPTPLLDFSTDPEIAGFFASDGTLPAVTAEEEELSCIICVNGRRLEQSWREMNERAQRNHKQARVRILKTDVKNLWRLQAQKGLFIDVRVDPTLLEMFSGFFRILFPYHGPSLTSLPREAVYPDKKSHLEVLLGQYFYAENFAAAGKALREFFTPITDTSRKVWRGEVEAFTGGLLPPPHESWGHQYTRSWLEEPDERFPSVLSPEKISLRLRAREKPLGAAHRIRDEILDFINEGKSSRHHSVDWNILDADGHPLTVEDELSEPLENDPCPQISCDTLVSFMWDGMRRLPFSDEQIATSIGNYVVIASGGYSATKQLLGKLNDIDIASGGARTRAFVSEKGILSCIRSDIFDFITPGERKEIEESKMGIGYGLLSILGEPSRLFEFTGFIDVFAQEVLPTQFLIRLEKDLILFNPIQIEVLGNS